MTKAERCFDVLIVGGGPAGAAAAIALARRGAEVLLVERRAFPRSKVCGGCLGPRAIACLNQLDIDPLLLAGAARLDRVRIAVRQARAELPLPAGVAVDRAALDMELLGTARAAGAEIWTEARAWVDGVVDDGRRVRVEHRAKLLTVAAGLVLLATGLPPTSAMGPGVRVGLSQTRRALGSSGPAEGEVQMVAGTGGYLGMVRYADGRLNVAASIRAASLRGARPGELVDELLSETGMPALSWREGWKGTPPLRTWSPVEFEDRVLPIGDAAGFWEPFTGEGIGWSLEAGIGVASVALEFGEDWDRRRAAAWLRAQRARTRRLQRRSRIVAALSSHPRMAGLALTVVRRLPATGRWLVPATPARSVVGKGPAAAQGAA